MGCVFIGLLAFLFLSVLSCDQSNSPKNVIKSIIYLPEIHKTQEIYDADSLHFIGNDSIALLKYRSILKQNLAPIFNNYVNSKILELSQDTIEQSAIFKKLAEATPAALHPACYLSIGTYELDNKDMISYPSQIQTIQNQDIGNYYKAIANYLLARQYDEVQFKLDSTWHYLLRANNYFNNLDYITPIQKRCLEKLSNASTYLRKNLLAIRYANLLFDFDKYIPSATDIDTANAYAVRAFMIFREGKYEETLDDVNNGLAHIDSNENPELYQNLMKSRLVVYMLQDNDSLWQKTAVLIDDNIQKRGRDYLEMNRWKGQYLVGIGKYKEAIAPLKKALSITLSNESNRSARYSTICYLLSMCHEEIGEYDQSLEYMAKNEQIDKSYQHQEMLQHLRKAQDYTFVSALRCANIYYSKYKIKEDKTALLDAKSYLDVIDEVMFKQLKVAEENAILQFYLESGREYFHLGMDVNYELYRLTKENKYLESFFQYSEKNKNSLLYRDISMAKLETDLPKDWVYQEFYLRSAIKEEKLKGLRNNQKFNNLVDEYESLETKIKLNYTSFVDVGLIRSPTTLGTYQKQLIKENASILIIDETNTQWYMTLIKKDTTIIQRVSTSDKVPPAMIIKQIRTFDLKSNDDQSMKCLREGLFPPQILDHISSKLYFISDGMFNLFPIATVFQDLNIEIINYPSTKILQIERPKMNSKDGVAIFAFSDPETIRSLTRTKLNELPGTYKEAQMIAKQYPNAKVFTGKHATKANFIKMYQNPDIKYIHLAMHGVANSTLKDDVKIYFRTTSGGIDSLYGYELLRQSSSVCKVVLSACQSGLGTYVNGEGTFSLPRYFMINGATEVVSNYWDVEDNNLMRK